MFFSIIKWRAHCKISRQRSLYSEIPFDKCSIQLASLSLTQFTIDVYVYKVVLENKLCLPLFRSDRRHSEQAQGHGG